MNRSLAKFLLVVVACYLLLKIPGVVYGKPVPASLVTIYMFFIVVSALLAMTATDEGARSLFAPVARLASDPALKAVRNVVLVVLPLAAGVLTYASVSAVPAPPTELRSIHPAPPASISVRGEMVDLGTLVNPAREYEKTDLDSFADVVEAGRDVYFSRCVFCHGARLDGRGHFAHALKPRPLPFVGTDTIAQLTESYLFWRVIKGGAGLPREAAPWSSAMPAFEDDLTEDEVWAVITFLYDFTGNRPRSWD